MSLVVHQECHHRIALRGAAQAAGFQGLFDSVKLKGIYLDYI
jgi:hypothetical protein